MKSAFFIWFTIILLVNADAQKIEITNYKYNATIKQNSGIYVEEYITVKFIEPSRGIVRDLPFRYKNEVDTSDVERSSSIKFNYEYQYINYVDFTCSEPYKTDYNNDYITYKVGDPDTFLEGSKTYKFTYTMYNVPTEFKNEDIVNLNIIGSGWDSPILKLNFNVKFEKAINPTHVYCKKSTNYRQDDVKTVHKGSQFSGSTDTLLPLSSVSIEFGVPKRYFKRYRAPIDQLWGKFEVDSLIKIVSPASDGNANLTEHLYITTTGKDSVTVAIGESKYGEKPQSTKTFLNGIEQTTSERSIRIPPSRNTKHHIEFHSISAFEFNQKYILPIIQSQMSKVKSSPPILKQTLIIKDYPKFAFIENIVAKTPYLKSYYYEKDLEIEFLPSLTMGHPNYQYPLNYAYFDSVDFKRIYYYNHHFENVSNSILINKNGTVNYKKTFNFSGVDKTTSYVTLPIYQHKTISEKSFANYSLYNLDRMDDYHAFIKRDEHAGFLADQSKLRVFDVSVTGPSKMYNHHYSSYGTLDLLPGNTEIEYKSFGEIVEMKDNYILESIVFDGNKSAIKQGQFVMDIPKATTNFKFVVIVQNYLGRNSIFGKASDTIQLLTPFAKIDSNSSWNIEDLLTISKAKNQLLITAPYGLPKGTVVRLRTELNAISPTLWQNILLFAINNIVFLVGIGILFLLVFHWYLFGRKKLAPIAIEYFPPENITPTIAGVVWDNQVDQRDLIALLYYWEGKKIISITEKDGKLYLTKISDLLNTVHGFESAFFNGLFAGQKSGVPFNLENASAAMYKGYYNGSINLKWFLTKSNYFSNTAYHFAKKLKWMVAIILLIGVFVCSRYSANTSMAIIMGITITAVAFVLPYFYNRYSKNGLKMYAKLLGFKKFIEVAEKEKLEKITLEYPDYFSQTIAFAIVMGLGEKWSSKFKEIDHFKFNKNPIIRTERIISNMLYVEKTIEKKKQAVQASRIRSSSGSYSSSQSSSSSWSFSTKSKSSSRSSLSGSSSSSSKSYSAGSGYGGGGGSAW